MAATYTVTNNGDNTSYPGTSGQLRWAIWQTADGDVIDFNLSSGNEAINIYSVLLNYNNITIDGDNTAGSGTNITVKVTTPGGSTYAVLKTGNYNDVIINNMTMQGGHVVSGGGVIDAGYTTSLTLENCIIKDGVNNNHGGGIYAYNCNLTINNCTISDNESPKAGVGISASGGDVIINNSTFYNNLSTITLGNIYGGGAYFYECDVIIDKTTFSNNRGGNRGGGLCSCTTGNSTLTLTNSTFNNNNTAVTNSGSGGGLYWYGNATITNCTFVNNVTLNSGGGLYLGGSFTYYLTNVTVAGNNNTYDSYDRDGLSFGGTLYIKNSLLANNGAGDFYTSGGTVNDNGYNIVENSSGYTFSGTGDITGNQASLWGTGASATPSPADNDTGFGTQTLALSSGSVAINAGNNTANGSVSIPATDQRGGNRIDAVDIGAYEFGSDSILPVNLSSFYAIYNGDIPTLYWTTQTETNNEYWNVYRGSNDNFTTASQINSNPVPGNGTTNYASDYVFIDPVSVVQNTTYWYWIEDVSTDGETEVHEPITLSIPFEDTPIIPATYGLQQNYPNPFNPSTAISFALSEDSDVEVIIYNVKGGKVKTIFNDHVYADQTRTVVWDGNDANGKQVSSGVYFYKLITETKEYQKKMLMVK